MTQKRKRELILIAVLCLAALLLLLWQRLGSSKRGMRVIVSQYGTVVGDYPLSKDREDVFQTSDGGVNTLIIHNGEAWISEANCPDKVCVHTGRISRTGEIIACLPHRLVMTATPIPRTVAMTVFGDLDVSVLDTLPAGPIPHVRRGPVCPVPARRQL